MAWLTSVALTFAALAFASPQVVNALDGLGGTVQNFTYTATQSTTFITSNYTTVAASVAFARSSCDTGAPAFPVVETTIASVHAAMLAGNLTCSGLVSAYLQRIAFYDKTTTLNSIRELGPNLTAVAADMDSQLATYKATGQPLPDLFCVPILAKDNMDTVGVPTVNGAVVLLDNYPSQDATIIAQVKAAGAIILAKGNMAEWAFSNAVSIGSAFGIVRNPYDLDHVTAGSSGGPAAGVSANLALIALGTDTGNSIRGPSGHNSLVGIRSTLGMTSRAGIIPLILNRDIGGPIGRTVTDVATVFQNIAGINDPRDDITQRAFNSTLNPYGIPSNYTQFLKLDGLQGKRIGVLRTVSDLPDTDSEFQALFTQAINDLEAGGSTIVDNFTINGNSLGDMPWDGSTNWYVGFGANGSYVYISDDNCPNFRQDLETYLSTAGTSVKTLSEIYYNGGYHPSVLASIVGELNTYNGSYADLPTPAEKALGAVCSCGSDLDNPCRLEFRTRLIESMDAANVDAIIYPDWANPPRLIGDYDSPLGDNSQMIPPNTGAPGIVVPMGYNSRGLPASLQINARPFDEPVLFEIAYAYEQLTKHRNAPPTFPECVPPPAAAPAPGASTLSGAVAAAGRRLLASGMDLHPSMPSKGLRR